MYFDERFIAEGYFHVLGPAPNRTSFKTLVYCRMMQCCHLPNRGKSGGKDGPVAGYLSLFSSFIVRDVILSLSVTFVMSEEVDVFMSMSTSRQPTLSSSCQCALGASE